MADAHSPVVQQALAKLAADQQAPAVAAEQVPASLAAPIIPAVEAAAITPPEQQAMVDKIAQPATQQPLDWTPELKAQFPGLDPRYVPPAEAAQQPAQPILDLEAVAPLASPEVIQPTQAEIDAKVNEAFKPAREAAAFDSAFKEVEKIKLENARREKARQDELDQKFSQLDGKLRNSSLQEIMQNGSWGQRIGAAIAIGLGGAAQGVGKLKSNPVLDMFDKMVDQQAQRDKLTLEEKNMLSQQLIQQGRMDIDKLENATQNAFRKDQLALMRQQMDQRQQQLREELRVKMQGASGNKYSGLALSPQEYATLTPEEQRAVVTLQDGRRVLAANATDAREYKKFSTEVMGALQSIDKLQELAKSTPRSMAFTNPVEYANRKAAADTLKTKIVGALRLPYTGPGVLTDAEREALIQTIGSPIDFFAVQSRERARLSQVKEDLESNLSTTAKARGVMEPVVQTNFYLIQGQAVPEARVLQMYQAAKPNIPKEKLLQLIQSKLPRM